MKLIEFCRAGTSPVILATGAIALQFISGCTTPPRIAPRFDKPSVAPIERANTAIAEANTKTKTHIGAAREIVRTIHLSLPEDQVKIDALTRELDSASSAVDLAENALANAVGALSSVDAQLQQQTDKANQLADSYDKSAAQITSLKESRHRWVKFFWYSAAANALCAIWIFRKPLMLAAGFPPL